MVLDAFELALVLGRLTALEVVERLLVGADAPLEVDRDSRVDFPRATGGLETLCSATGSGERGTSLAGGALREARVGFWWMTESSDSATIDSLAAVADPDIEEAKTRRPVLAKQHRGQ
jgi:hypothetical protein